MNPLLGNNSENNSTGNNKSGIIFNNDDSITTISHPSKRTRYNFCNINSIPFHKYLKQVIKKKSHNNPVSTYSYVRVTNMNVHVTSSNTNNYINVDIVFNNLLAYCDVLDYIMNIGNVCKLWRKRIYNHLSLLIRQQYNIQIQQIDFDQFSSKPVYKWKLICLFLLCWEGLKIIVNDAPYYNCYDIYQYDILSLWNVLSSDRFFPCPSNIFDFIGGILRLDQVLARFGKSNGENQSCLGYIAALMTHAEPWAIRQCVNADVEFPIMTFARFGISTTFIYGGNDYNGNNNGNKNKRHESIINKHVKKIVFIAGEYEDYYDPDFYIYNDVVLIEPTKGYKYLPKMFITNLKRIESCHQKFFSIENAFYFRCGHEIWRVASKYFREKKMKLKILGYPEDAFSPTDSHRSLYDSQRNVIWIVGGYVKKYKEEIQAEKSFNIPLRKFDLNTYEIHEIQTHGTKFKHFFGDFKINMSDDKNKIIVQQQQKENFPFQVNLNTFKWEQIENI